jgi:hypothetical protein
MCTRCPSVPVSPMAPRRLPATLRQGRLAPHGGFVEPRSAWQGAGSPVRRRLTVSAVIRRRAYDAWMARYRIEENPEGVAIQVTEASGHQRELLDAFQECQSGHCTCPTDEYEKVQSMEIDAAEDEISLRLKAKAGTRFDTDEISACLAYTTSRVLES